MALAIGLSRCLRQHRVDDLHDELLLGAWQLVDAIHLLLQLGRGAALGCCLAVVGELGFRCHTQALGDLGKLGDGNAPAPGLVGVHGLLRDADQLGQLRLRDVLFLADARNAPAECDEERAFVVADGHGIGSGE